MPVWLPAAEQPRIKGRHAVDPYLRWADATGWRGYGQAGSGVTVRAGAAPGRIRILACARDEASLRALMAQPEMIEIAPMYGDALPGGDGRLPLHFTASIDPADLGELTSSYVTRWELAVPLREAQAVTSTDTAGRFGAEKSARALEPGRVFALPGARRKPVARRRVGDAIAVIDYGLPFLHQNFLDATGRRTRVAAVWDQEQRSLRGGGWVAPPRAGYGREMGRAAIEALCRHLRPRGRGAQRCDETEIYRGLDCLIAYRDPRRRAFVATHGAHVADLAGGRDDPLNALRPAALRIEPQRDAAAAAQLVLVQLPGPTASDSTGASLGAQILDAVRYVLDICRPDARVVVNISYGSFASAHDGRSLIEMALDELLERRRRNFAVVLAAGNSRQAGCHVRRSVTRDRSALLRLNLAEHDTTDTFVEVWYPRPAALAVGLQARVRTAGRDWSDWVGAGQAVTLHEPALNRVAGLLQHELYTAGSDRKAMILLALAPTQAPADDDGPLAEPGLWEIEIKLAAAPGGRVGPDDEIVVDAWIERDDPADAGAGKQSAFVDLDADDAYDTLSNLACGEHTVVVGGYRVEDRSVASYSSLPRRGARGRTLPMVLAACEESAMLPTLRAAAVRSGDTHRMNGTSVAAPVVARHLFRAMAGGVVEREEWAAVLRGLTKDANAFVLKPP